ncbi:hypothetical protein K2173_015967 [Erythroxylum novogranatense]|uniref:GTD-binding domain-containing protein n=1 Tax=Erythroxylum novogranatense TaxID=1862640 RepID=A0AAV8SEW9_9ROSI|nr:hypothetical protein K2173_015967 [Erythroxylum novogranatense]
MAETNALVEPETDIMALKEALYAQQQLLQQLSSDLDVEREASSTAASEALSMILRLQGEKASLKMEASQYKRMAEEKMCHAEEALAVFEDLIYQREMEIASLEFQVQAYKYRLLSMGCNDLGVCESKFPENLLMQRHDTLLGEKGLNSNVRRLNSLPQAQAQDKDSNLKTNPGERKRLAVPATDLSTSIVDESEIQEVNDSEKKSGISSAGDINSYWEQIKRLDERVKEISDCKDLGRYNSTLRRGGTWSPSLFSQASIGTVLDSTRVLNAGNGHSDQSRHHEHSQEKEAPDIAACSSCVLDIFEVPKATKISKSYDSQKMECRKLTMEGENKLGKANSTLEETFELIKEGKTDRLKTALLSSGHDRKPPKPRDGTGADSNVSVLRPSTGFVATQADFQQLSQRIERLERTRTYVKPEITVVREDELKLLKEISDQLKVIRSEMKTVKAKPSLLPDEPSLDPLQEAMIHFWL